MKRLKKEMKKFASQDKMTVMDWAAGVVGLVLLTVVTAGPAVIGAWVSG